MNTFTDQPLVTDALSQQRAWARRTRRSVSGDSYYLASLNDALLMGSLDEETRFELAAGAGGELNRLVSLRSSSCLAVNVFAPWRANPGPIAGLLGGDPMATSLRFEQRFPTGLRGTSPHLDVVIDGTPLIAIESKFLESYSPANNHFADSYFARPSLWDGLPNLRRIAEDIAAGLQVFEWLKAAQLIKHALGLRMATAHFRLLLLWYRLDSPVSERIEAEISRFADEIGDDIAFSASTYQELFSALDSTPEPVPGYLAYLNDRYITEAQHV